jgi:hypothetical protein
MIRRFVVLGVLAVLTAAPSGRALAGDEVFEPTALWEGAVATVGSIVAVYEKDGVADSTSRTRSIGPVDAGRVGHVAGARFRVLHPGEGADTRWVGSAGTWIVEETLDALGKKAQVLVLFRDGCSRSSYDWTGAFVTPDGKISGGFRLRGSHYRYPDPEDPTRDASGVDQATLVELETVAARYRVAGAVDDALRVAPELCMDPGPRAALHVSTEHEGKKLYRLYAKDKDAYLQSRSVPGQWVVKESFAVADELRRTPGESKGLFILYRGPVRNSGCRGTPSDPWVFAVASPDGEILRAGRIASCVACHQHGTNEDLFGLDSKKEE